MELSNNFLNKLSLKIYLTNISFYITVLIVLLAPNFFINFFVLTKFWASFLTFFIIALLKIIYEKVIIYELDFKELKIEKLFIFVLVNSSVMTAVMFYLKPYIGYFSIPVAIIFSNIFVTKLKEFLWPISDLNEFFLKLNQKLNVNSTGIYRFYWALVGITYIAYAKLDLNFYYFFAFAFFIGILIEEYYNFTKVYEQKINTKFIIFLIIWALICSISSSLIAWVLMQNLGYSGQISSITSVVFIKLIQYLGTRVFILNNTKLNIF